ncbi:MAG: ParB N-terminal domain-containing protein [Phycisphaerae bacterium]|nr:ParB N-terminal domain-containing protein [Phycisphaerae bacterium]NIP50422.1 ParB N-terminal domain-containing protein [Phycisphaerae bacterium]NIS49550.1 ParB N-terminal domain-containing protein [Phycisphaerae bacterium]NIU07308.1 ParB N-terminal domain-containing protein [Phycisphaerae bacterium]NIU54877.1 ParB N-terminal domain-containing protein [Phycisphaerae bacterium]
MKKQLFLKDIWIDGKTQQRPVEDKVVARYAALMKDGSVFPPVEIIADGKSNYLWDGYHRVAAARKLGKKYIEANIKEGTQRDAIYLSFSANKTNAFPRQPGTAKGIIEKILKDEEWSKISTREIANHVGVT